MTQPASKRLVSEARLSDITTAATNAGIASAQSQINSSVAAAASSATAAQNSANLVGAPADTAIATAVNGAGTQTQTAVDNRIKPRAGKNAVTGWFHASGYGCIGDGTTDDTANLQAAIDAASAAGGGVVYVPEKYRVTVGLLLPSNVTLRGNNAGGQVGTAGSYSRITYAGPAGGTVISPKDRTIDNVNWGIHGLRIDGGGLAAIVVEFYRVSYSRFTDCGVTGIQSGGVGVLFDANVVNQCYFNVADNVKVDGGVGVRFQRGANANRWQGGKIGNGTTGMEFLSLSAGNLVLSTDFETATAKHIYIDAASNVFVGLHMEDAPIGFDVTVNGIGTRRFGTTLATSVVSYINDASVDGGPSVDRIGPNDTALRLGPLKVVTNFLSSGTTVTVDPYTYSGTANSIIRFFRSVTTSGLRQFTVYRGDGSNGTALFVDVTNRNTLLGDSTLSSMADGVGVVGIGNRLTAPTTNPIGGGILYAESGTLRYRTSAGATKTLAGNITSKSISYTAGPTDEVILATGGTSGITITLLAATLGASLVIKKVDAGVGAVTVATTSSQTIDGATTKALSAQWASVRVVSDGTAWFIV